MQLVPDIEFKINYNRFDKDKGENYLAKNVDGDIEDLLAYFQQQLILEDSWPKICLPETRMSQMHISALPPEVLMYIFRWVVSSELDMRTLEQLSLVCRGFYICARDSDLWRSACLRVWGRTTLAPFKSWREMFLERPRVRFDGVYISKVSYVRQGEESLDGFYRAWHHVAYYRVESVMLGYFRLSQETDNQTKVFVVVSKKKEEGPEVQRNRFCRRNPAAPEAEHSFHVGLRVPSGGRQCFNKLTWIHHSCHITYRPTGETVVTAFDMDNMYAPFFFARVKSYTAFSERPL
ncbi:hypothetical protein CRUP_035423 [Coryphaenoides rupestris]|nr:hypothetical protein CRUP_035423 [Coryphaenoides rupestris]